MILKALFSSQARIKLLKTFLINPDKEFFIRQLTRLLDEQINSIRRELDNLKKIGAVRSRVKNRKKFFHINKNFILYSELRSIFVKISANDNNIKKDIENIGEIDLLVLAGQFVNDATSEIDLLVVGDVVSKKIEDYIEKDLNKTDVKFSVLTRADFDYRLDVKDVFIMKILKNANNVFLINKIKYITN